MIFRSIGLKKRWVVKLKSQLKVGALLSYVVLALQNLVGLVYTPFMLRMLGKSEYGLYSIAASIVAYLTILDFGFGNAIVRYTAKFRAEGKIEEQSKMFGMFFMLYCGVGFLALIIGGILCYNAEYIFDASMTAMELSRTKVILALMVLNLSVTFPLGIFGSIITAYEQFVFQKVITIVRIVLNTLTMIFLLTIGYKALALVVVTTVFNLLTLLSNFWYCKHYLKIKLKFGRFQWGFLKEVSVYSFWIFLNAIMDRVYWSTGQFVLGVWAGTAAVAVYAVAIQLENFYMSFSTAISGVFLPKVTAMTMNDSDRSLVSDLFIKTGRIQYCVLAFVLSGFIIFGRQFVELWAGVGYENTYHIALLFFVPFTIPLIQNIGLVILQARNQMRFRSLLGFIAAFVSFGLQLPLAKSYGGVGCALGVSIVLLLAQGLVMNVYYRVKQDIDIHRFWKEIIKMSVAPFIVTIGFHFVIDSFKLNSWISLGLGIIVYMVVYFPLFFFFSMNEYEKKLLLTPIQKMLKKI